MKHQSNSDSIPDLSPGESLSRDPATKCSLLYMQTSKPNSAHYWIEKLNLEPHPEGGYFRQTYRSPVTIARVGLPPGFTGDRAASTAIYFLLEGENFSAFHRLKSDEVWHFYAGAPLTVHVIEPDGKYFAIELGNDPEAGQSFQAVVPAGCWFASHVADWKSWALVGCTVAPGFEYADFEIAKREDLRAKYPQHQAVIERLARVWPLSLGTHAIKPASW